MNFRTTFGLSAASIVLSTGLALSVAGQSGTVAASPAQNPPTPARGEGRIRRPDLNLTADQQAQLKSIRQSQRDQIMSLRNDKSLSPEQRMEKVRSIREGMRQKVFGVLTPQQQQTIQSVRTERQARVGNRGRGGDGALNFTTEQRAQLKSIHQNTAEQVKAVRNDSTLTQEQRFAKLQSIHQNTRQQVTGILTPEQQQKMKDGRRGGPRGGPGRFGPRGRRGGRFGPGRLGAPAGAPQAQPSTPPPAQP